MIALRVAAVALLLGIVGIWIFSTLVIASGGADDYLQDSYYVVVHLRSLLVSWLWPVMVMVFVFVASWFPVRGGSRGLWLAYAGAVLLVGSSILLNFAYPLGFSGMPRRYPDGIALQSREHIMTVGYCLSLAGLACTVAGAIWWAVTHRAARRDPAA